jgi:predicted acetyltransferase
MALTLRWVGEDQRDRVAETRAHCYGAGTKDVAEYQQRLRNDGRVKAGDWLLAERDGVAVGTTTSLSFNMWVRGTRVPCQGVAWVGTIKTHRRGGKGTERGIASQLMTETLRKGRERNEIVSALMPFRASYYEHFGYGMAETRNEWTVPLSILPTGDFEGMRFMKGDDLPLIQACHQRAVERGQCDIERSAGGWTLFGSQWPNGFVVVDQPDPGGPVQSWMYFTETVEVGKSWVRIEDGACNSPQALLRQMHFLASLKDEFSTACLQLPPDLPLHQLLKETQLPHRPVEHAVARVATVNRLQVRILDHARFLEAVNWPGNVKGRATVGVKECEGPLSTFGIEVEAGRARVKPATGTAQVQCVDRVWAVLACGDVSATTLARLGLIRASDPGALELLDALAVGPAPFCNERF